MKLLSTVANAKIEKTNAVGGENYLYAEMSLMPNHRICGGSKAAGCMDACLRNAGRGVFPNVRQARERKSEWFMSHPTGFKAQLVDELESLLKKAQKQGKTLRVRLNCLSDISWELQPCLRNGMAFKGIPQAFPEIQFYDYTKLANRLGKTPANYHLTFSYSGVPTYKNQVKVAQSTDSNIAVVFHGKELPVTFMDRKVIDGDLHDARIDDPKGVIVGLRAKGTARKDVSGFVVRV
jgi:restriction endonuclease S subunit